MHTYSVTGSHDKSIRVWSTTTWECTTVIGRAHNGQCVQHPACLYMYMYVCMIIVYADIMYLCIRTSNMCSTEQFSNCKWSHRQVYNIYTVKILEMVTSVAPRVRFLIMLL